jgi:DNA-binding CsgD family transcriptional regulator
MLGETALAQHDVTRASGWLAEALVLLHAIGDPVFTLFAIEDLADAEIRAGRPTRAARWLGATEVLRDRLGAPRALPNVQDWQRMIEAIRSQLGGNGLERALAAGRGLSLEQVLAEAVPSPTPRLAQPRHEPINDAGGLLTRREQEVARLLVQGLSDREIGVRLSITVGTASLHVHRILAKLKIRSRWQIAAGLAEDGALNDDDRLATPAKGCV